MSDIYGFHRFLSNHDIDIKYDGAVNPHYIPPVVFGRVTLDMSAETYDQLAEQLSTANKRLVMEVQLDHEAALREKYPALATAYTRYQSVLNLIQ